MEQETTGPKTIDPNADNALAGKQVTNEDNRISNTGTPTDTDELPGEDDINSDGELDDTDDFGELDADDYDETEDDTDDDDVPSMGTND